MDTISPPVAGIDYGGSDCCCQGACCVDADCSIKTESECDAVAGNFQGKGSACDDDPPPCNQGGCCVDADCSIQTEADCDTMGGNYQGGGSDCEDNPCTIGGCCVGTDCTIQTEADCATMGGTYQGGGSDCADNPCAMTPCLCGFNAHDGSGRKFLTRTTIGSLTWHTGAGECGCLNANINYQYDETIDPVSCTSTSSCFGTASGHAECPANPNYQTCDCNKTASGNPCSWSGCDCPDCDGNIDFWLGGLNCSSYFVHCHNDCSATHCNYNIDWIGDGPTTFYIDEYLTNECAPI